ncbi:hypothetical protein KSS87_010691 [Heliosperma pusillum]|nr:hypothetical protein KSS87_010691 [Heliosperma pusillum]
MAEQKKKNSEVTTQLLEKVSETISAINSAQCVDDVVLSLHSSALLLFPIDTSSLSGVISEQYRDQLKKEEVPSVSERRSQLWEVFYRGVAFPTLARFLIYGKGMILQLNNDHKATINLNDHRCHSKPSTNLFSCWRVGDWVAEEGSPVPVVVVVSVGRCFYVASNWLPRLPITAQNLVYDVFFVKGLSTEVVQAVIPCLDHNAKIVRSNAERLIVICLLENEGVIQIARDLSVDSDSEESSQSVVKLTVSRVAQLVASVPDKARRGAPKSLSPHYFFKNITTQLLAGAEEKSLKALGGYSITASTVTDATFQFVGEMFTRICRRGSTDLLLSELIPHILRRVRSFLSSQTDTNLEGDFMLDSSFRFWFLMIEIIKDAYVVERMAEQILRQLVAERANDIEAYWILWTLFQRSKRSQTTVRFLFIEKFILLKVFPLCCLRWMLQFSVFGCPPDDGKLKKGDNKQLLLETIQRVVVVWSKRDFVQSAPLEQQVRILLTIVLYFSSRISSGEPFLRSYSTVSYMKTSLKDQDITAAAGLMLETMSKEELDSTKDVMRSVLEGVSCSRLENPDDLVRKMACSIALVFSKVIDPKNPLFLDDSFTEEDLDWEFGLATSKATNQNSESQEIAAPSSILEQKLEPDHGDTRIRRSKVNTSKKRSSKFKPSDSNEVDQKTFNGELLFSEEEVDYSSEDSEGSSDSSLQPYDLTDDDTDLKKKISNLVDIVGALRKTDDPDGVERALDVAEKFVRASPDELRHVASDLVRTLIQARCADIAVEGEEESAEEKRQKALVALLVMCPFESLNAMNKLLYSPHLDVSQRVMILDAMTEAAQELANTKTIVQKKTSRPLISVSEEPEAWFLPSNKGPSGAGTWKEIPDSKTPLNMTYSFVRELPLKAGQIRKGKTRRWGRTPENVVPSEADWSRNKFPLYAAAFMLPAMQGFDKKSHGVDLLGRDFIVLGKLIYMLGICMKCTALHPEASALAPPLLDMLSSRGVCHHKEAYVRRAALFAASCIVNSLHPSFIASALLEGNQDISRGLEWIRTWALQIAESDTDRECCTTAMACLQLHAEMSLQASRAVETAGNSSREKGIELPGNLLKGQIKIPGSSSLFLS